MKFNLLSLLNTPKLSNSSGVRGEFPTTPIGSDGRKVGGKNANRTSHKLELNSDPVFVISTPTAYCQLPTADCEMRTANIPSRPVNRPSHIVHFLIVAFAFLLSLPALAQPQPSCPPMLPRGGNQDWGTGAYYLPKALMVRVYTDTEGTYFGTLVREPRSLRVVARRNEWRRVDYSDLEWIGNHHFKYLKVKPAEDVDYVRVFWNTYDGARYMKKSELQEAGALYHTYRDYLLGENLQLPEAAAKGREAALGVNINTACLHLRAEPDTMAQSLQCIRGNRFGDSTFMEFKILDSRQDWAKVQLIKWQYDPELEATGAGCTYRPQPLEEGWIKAVEDNGFPNIWFATSY